MIQNLVFFSKLNKMAFVIRAFTFIYAISLFLLGCSSKENDSIFNIESFYTGGKNDADLTLLNQYWSIYEVNSNDRTAELPHNYSNCDRDFFTFQDDGVYKEYVVSNSGCVPEEQDLNWSFDNGIITLTNSFKDFNEMVVVELTNQKFIFRAKFDVDQDGEDNIFQFLAKPYQPDESNFYENRIERDESFPNKIRLKWTEYDGIYDFERYEIYLSTSDCNPDNATLIATINNSETTFFEDENPAEVQQLCYYLKIHTDKDVLFKGNAASISTAFLDVPGVALTTPEVINNSIQLNWEKYEGLYFSHYEIVVKNYLNSYGQFSQEHVLGKIDNIDTTTFLDSTPPLLKDPVYEIRVYNKFGKQNFYHPQLVESAQEAEYKPNEVIDIINIRHFVGDSSEPVIYLFGALETVYESKIIRFNYETSKIEAISNIELNFGQSKNMRLVQSNGTKELMYLGNSNLLVFDAGTLEYKYNLENDQVRFIDDFMYLENNLFAMINDEFIYTVSRDFANTTLIDTQTHFEAAQNSNNYFHHVLKISNSRVLIGNANESESISFDFDFEGNLSNKQILNVPITSTYSKKTVFNATDNSIINFMENRIYSLENFSVQSFEQPLFPLALVAGGTQIFGSNNDPDWYVDENSLHEKEIRIFNLVNSNLEIMDTEGYPHFIFENNLGEIFSLSTFFKRNESSTSHERPDFFVEKIR